MTEGCSVNRIISKHRSFAMGMAMISIILFHFQFQTQWMWPFNLLGYWGVDIFQFVSGFGCVYALKKSEFIQKFYYKRILRILPTCLFIGICVYVIDVCIGWEFNRTASIVERLFSLHRWYILLILVSYALCPLFYRILNKYGWVSVIILMIGCAVLGCFVPRMGVWRWPWIFFRVPPFIVGMYVAISDFKVKIGYLVLASACFLLAVAYILVLWWAYFRHLPTDLFALPYSLSLPVLVGFICYIGGGLKRNLIYKTVELLGIYSLEIYLIHEVTLSWLKSHFNSQLVQFAILVPTVAIGVFVTKYSVGKVYALLTRKTTWLKANSNG